MNQLVENQFSQFNLPAVLLDGLTKNKITAPTDVQKEALPIALEGFDLLASAQTGTGKTLAYLLPLLNFVMNNQGKTALVLTPTRELATQVRDEVNKLIPNIKSVNTALLIGGEPMPKQFFQLKKKPSIIIGTPGRINDHLTNYSLDLKSCEFLVLDETDRMLDIGFSEQLDEISKFLPKQKQTLMFSATLPSSILKLAEKYTTEPKRIAIKPNDRASTQIQQDTIRTTHKEKFDHLLQELEKREGSIIIFVKTKVSADKISERLNEFDHQSAAIHGDLRQHKREKVLNAFLKQKKRILVATDVAARGIDVPHIQHVINFDLPSCPEDYVHRIGRTGRAGKFGFALSFIVPKEDDVKWNAIRRLLDPSLPMQASNRGGSSGSKRGGGGGSRQGRSSSGGRDFARNRSDSNRSDSRRSGTDSRRGGADYGTDSRRSGPDSRASGTDSRRSSTDYGTDSRRSGPDSRVNGTDSRRSSTDYGTDSRRSGPDSRRTSTDARRSGADYGTDSRRSGPDSRRTSTDARRSGADYGTDSRRSGPDSRRTTSTDVRRSGTDSRRGGADSGRGRPDYSRSSRSDSRRPSSKRA